MLKGQNCWLGLTTELEERIDVEADLALVACLFISGLTCCSGTMGAGAGTHTTPSPTRLVLSRPPVAGNDTSCFFFSFDSGSQDQAALAALDEGKGAGG